MKSNCLISFWPKTIKLENDEWTAHFVVLYVNGSGFQLAGIFRISTKIRVKWGEFGFQIKQLAFVISSSVRVEKKNSTIQAKCTTIERTLICRKEFVQSIRITFSRQHFEFSPFLLAIGLFILLCSRWNLCALKRRKSEQMGDHEWARKKNWSNETEVSCFKSFSMCCLLQFPHIW